VAVAVAVTGCSGGNGSGSEPPAENSETTQSTVGVETGPVQYTVEVVAAHPHDTAMFTQGLEFVDGLLVESGGGRGRSSLRIYDPADGTVLRSVDVDDTLFAEGVTVVGDRIWQLTWQSGKALVYDVETLEPVTEVGFGGEGWGLCLLDDRLVMSNGSDRLTFRRPSDFEAIGSVTVTLDGSGPISQLNELECATDDQRETVWANVWRSTTIYGIDPGSGRVTAVVDASSLVPPGYESDRERVLNGIAIHPDTGRLWLTGKEWPVLYEVELVAP